MDFLKNALTGLFLFLSTLSYAQTETEKVIQTIIDLEKDLKETILLYPKTLTVLETLLG